MKKEILKITKEDSEYEVIATGNPDDIVRALIVPCKAFSKR